ncbi:MAG: zf-HC2 domain-containing protein [Lachnospiraceae bacterium]|nr:zf-HC2 domain-containing protein [Lachnospiraceae bacterium]
MNCKEFERLIPKFVEDKLDFMTLKQFGAHMDKCSGCREELQIQFLVIEGMQRLEEGDAFDLQSELNRRMEETKHKVRFHEAFLKVAAVLETIIVIGLAGVVVWILF